MSQPSLTANALPAWPSREREAQTLAGWLRTSRLSFLHGESGAGKTTLLKNGVLPLLNRRATDVAPARDDGAAPASSKPQVVVPFPDRRGAGRGPDRSRAEVAIVFDEWEGVPLAKLQARIDEALSLPVASRPPNRLSMAGSLAALSKRLGVRFLLVFDDFDACLVAAGHRAEARQFLNEMVQAMNRSGLPAHFLLVLRDEANPDLGRLRSRLPSVEPLVLRLERHREAVVPPVLRQVSGNGHPAAPEPVTGPTTAPTSAPTTAPAPARPSSKPEVSAPRPRHEPTLTLREWQAAIDTILADVARSARPDASALRTEDLSVMLDAGRAPTPPERPVSATTSAAVPEAAAAPANDASAAPPADNAERAAFDAQWDDLFRRNQRAVSPPEPQPERPPDGADAPASALRPVATLISSEPPPEPAQAPPRFPTALKWTAAALVLGVLIYGLWPGETEPGPPASTSTSAPAPVPTQVPTPTPAPIALPPPTAAALPPPAPANATAPVPAVISMGLVTDVEDGTDTRIATELGLALPADSGVALKRLPSSGWANTLSDLAGQPRLAITRYDALQAARRAGSVHGLQVIAPLYVDEVYAIARADSRLRFFHQLKGLRINIGPAQSSRALTGSTLYRALFGAAPPTSPASALGEDAALTQLLTGKTLDAMIVVGAQPSEWLARLSPDLARSVKLLRLDRNDAASRRALQQFLPATVRTSSLGTPPGSTPVADLPADAADKVPTFGVMAFLVGAEPVDAAASARLGSFARALCRALPTLQRDGHPKWREVRPGQQFEVGWPYAAAATEALQACALPGERAVASTGAAPESPPSTTHKPRRPR